MSEASDQKRVCTACKCLLNLNATNFEINRHKEYNKTCLKCKERRKIIYDKSRCEHEKPKRICLICNPDGYYQNKARYFLTFPDGWYPENQNHFPLFLEKSESVNNYNTRLNEWKTKFADLVDRKLLTQEKYDKLMSSVKPRSLQCCDYGEIV